MFHLNAMAVMQLTHVLKFVSTRLVVTRLLMEEHLEINVSVSERLSSAVSR